MLPPSSMIATVCGIGLLPKAPGTWGSLVTLPIAWLVVGQFGGAGLLVTVLAVSLIGWWAAARHQHRTGRHDAPEVVIDEVAGQGLALLLVPLDPVWYGTALALFRLLDIAKPWPIGWLDQRIGGGLGVMLDDLAAGAVVAMVLLITQYMTGL